TTTTTTTTTATTAALPPAPAHAPDRLPLDPPRRRLLVALAFAAVSVFRWNRELAAVSSSSSSVSSASGRRRRPSSPLATVAYAVSITACPPKIAPRVFDAAAVLKRSVELNSWPIHESSRYGAKFYAFAMRTRDGTPDRCQALLSLAGWEVLYQRDEPLHPTLIKVPEGSILKMGIRADGCCGHLELIKLNAFKLTDHPAAVHLDLDTLVVNPLDELFDVMLIDHLYEEGREARRRLAEVVAPTYVNRRQTGDPAKSGDENATEVLANVTVDAFFTKDYNMIAPGRHSQRVGVQGGFLVVRPSVDEYVEMINMIYSGEFYGGTNAWPPAGWFKSGYGRHIWGAMTIQGFLAYYFDAVKPDRSVELNRCRYNHIADNARVSGFSRNPKFPRGTLLPFVRNASNPRYNFDDGGCRDGRAACDDVDCQRFPVEKARVLHYTYCKSPWKCNDCTYVETYKEPTCHSMTKRWFEVRRTIRGEGNVSIAALDRSTWDEGGPVTSIREDGVVEVREGNCYKEIALGYCRGLKQYVGMEHRNLSEVLEAV
ncbi:hypothetical protein ACHAWF_011343, partial [Thalassiosira exigua]